MRGGGEQGTVTVIVCTDPRGGMLFLGRRVSRDREILADIGALAPGGVLCHPFSVKYLTAAPLAHRADEALLEHAGQDDVCFIENLPLAKHTARIDRLIVYDFGERYPFDFSLDLDPAEAGLRLTDEREFVGYAHKCITRKVYER